MAIDNVKDGNIGQAMAQAQAKSVDAWSYYQAKGVKQNLAELLSFAETQKLIDDLPREHQKLVTELIPSLISTGGVQRVLQGLLAELDARHGPHPAFGRESDPLWYSPEYLRAATDALVAGAGTRADVLIDLMARVPDWRLAIAIWSEEHSGGHCMWHGVDPASPVHDTPSAAQVCEAQIITVGDMHVPVAVQVPPSYTRPIEQRAAPHEVPTVTGDQSLMFRDESQTWQG